VCWADLADRACPDQGELGADAEQGRAEIVVQLAGDLAPLRIPAP
jgi:hypothetical protein